MVPMADMFNAAEEYNAYWYWSDEKEGFLVDAKEDIPKDT